MTDLERVCPDWKERETWACGPAPMLDAAEEHWEEADLEDAAPPGAVHPRARRRRRRGRHDHLPATPARPPRPTAPPPSWRPARKPASGCPTAAGWASATPARSPSSRARCATCAAATRPRDPTNPSRPASLQQPVTARSTSDRKPVRPRQDEPPKEQHGYCRRQGVHPPQRRRRWRSSDASSTRSAPTSRSRAATTTRRTSTG